MAQVNEFIGRYRDLYRAARLYILIGNFIKITGLVIGGLIILVSILIALAGAGTIGQFDVGSGFATFFMGTFWGLLWGAITGGFFFLCGSMMSAQGQLLLTHSDTAIYASPFLSNEEKAREILTSD